MDDGISGLVLCIPEAAADMQRNVEMKEPSLEIFDAPPPAVPAGGSDMESRKFVSISARIGLSSLPKPAESLDKVVFDESTAFAFVSALFHFKGTVFAEIMPQLGFACGTVLISAAIEEFSQRKTSDSDEGDDNDEDSEEAGGSSFLPRDAQKFHALAGTVIGFLLALRTNLAYDRYYEGRKLIGNMLNALREAVSIAYTYRDDEGIQQSTQHDGQRPRELREFIRRKAMLLWAFARQDLRESKEGFDPRGGMGDREFDNETFALDPCRPAIAHLIDDVDLKRYSRLAPNQRPAAVMTEMRLGCGELSSYISEHERGFMQTEFLTSSKEVMDHYKAALRIVQTPMPFPYAHMLSVIVFAFVYITPFLYAGPFASGEGWVATMMLAFCFYGIQETGSKLENPFGWDTIDHDLERYGMNMCEETELIAEFAGTGLHGTGGESVSYLKPKVSVEDELAY